MAQPTFDFTLAGVCQAILVNTKSLAKGNYAMDLEKKLGALDFILDPSNGGVKATMSQNGKNIVRAKVLYKQPTKTCQILDGDDAKDSTVCDEGIESEEKEVDVVIDDAISTQPRKFTADKFHTICQDIPGFIKEYLDSDMRALRERLDAKILGKIAANVGKKYRQNGDEDESSEWTNVPLLHTANGQSNPMIGNFSELLLEDYTNMNFTGTPVLIGQGYLQTFLNLAKMSCCNSTNISYDDAITSANAAAFIDQNANSILGASNRFLMTTFGMSHLLWFNRNKGMGFPNNELVKNIVIQDPVYPGISWDLDFKYDDCNRVWSYQIGASFDVFNVYQADSFSTDSGESSPSCDDERLGVTGIWGYTATKSA